MPDGKLIPLKLPDDELNNYQGVLGHYHIQTNKVDPGPAFDWERVIGGANKILEAEIHPSAFPPRGGKLESRNPGIRENNRVKMPFKIK